MWALLKLPRFGGASMQTITTIVLAETQSDRRWLVERSGFGVRWQLSCDHLLLRHWHRVQEGLHRRFAEAPTSLMRPLFIVLADPQIQFGCSSSIERRSE